MTRSSERPPAVVVAVPAHNEAEHIARCLTSVAVAADLAVASAVADTVSVHVVAHRCDDDTAAIARAIVGSSVRGEVAELAAHGGVGMVRDVAVRRAVKRLDRPRAETWILSTDADTVVASDWVQRALLEGGVAGAVSVVGMAALDQPPSYLAARLAYDELIAAKLTVDATGVASHGHVYGASLAVRADAYFAVGGFSHHEHGEDQRLVDALAAAGHRILRTRTWSVVTSGRTTGRAAGGLADLLSLLELRVGMIGIGEGTSSA
jgi:hypothetical protein